MKRLFVLGGQASGKSAFAESLLKERDDVLYIATLDPQWVKGDKELAARIARHKKQRPTSWDVHVEPRYLPDYLRRMHDDRRCLLIDSLVPWLACCMDGGDDMAHATQQLMDALAHNTQRPLLVLVSAEIGMGVLPMTSKSRQFLDMLGHMHQRLGQWCDDMVMVIAGIPCYLKRDGVPQCFVTPTP